MKRFLIILLTLLLFVSCTHNKQTIKTQDTSNDVNTSITNESITDSISYDFDSIVLASPATQSISRIRIDETTTDISDVLLPEENTTAYQQSNSNEENYTISHTKHEGLLVYSIPNTMILRNTYSVSVRISASKDTLTITENLSGQIEKTFIPITQTMEAELIDPSPTDRPYFIIVNNTKGRQIIEDNDTYTEWIWDVTPIRSGQSPLKIVVSIIKNGNTKQTVYVDTVLIETNPKIIIKMWFEKYWQWLLSTIIIPFIIWFYNKRKKKEEK